MHVYNLVVFVGKTRHVRLIRHATTLPPDCRMDRSSVGGSSLRATEPRSMNQAIYRNWSGKLRWKSTIYQERGFYLAEILICSKHGLSLHSEANIEVCDVENLQLSTVT